MKIVFQDGTTGDAAKFLKKGYGKFSVTEKGIEVPSGFIPFDTWVVYAYDPHEERFMIKTTNKKR